jgi:hypothetical protein
MYTVYFHTDIISIHYSFVFINNNFLCESLCFTVVQLWFLGYGTTSPGEWYLMFLRWFSGLIWRAKCPLLHPQNDPWRWDHYAVSKQQIPITLYHIPEEQKHQYSVSLKYKQILKYVQYILLYSNAQLNLQYFRLSTEWILNLLIMKEQIF